MVSTEAEGGLASEADSLEEQARQATSLDKSEDLLRATSDGRHDA
jgi:hypothetical protein